MRQHKGFESVIVFGGCSEEETCLLGNQGTYLLPSNLRRLHSIDRVARHQIIGNGLIQRLSQHEPDVLYSWFLGKVLNRAILAANP